MKFEFNKRDVESKIKSALSTTAAGSVLSNVFLNLSGDELTIKAANTHSFVTMKCDVSGFEDGACYVSCDKFSKVLSSLPQDGNISFSTEENGGLLVATIKSLSKKVRYKLNCFKELGTFPEQADDSSITYISVNSKEFIDMLNQVVFAVSFEPARYVMSGVHFEKDGDNLVLVATDGRRLAYAKSSFSVADFNPVTIPTEGLEFITKNFSQSGDAEIGFSEQTFFAKQSDRKISSSLIGEPFLNYKGVIPASQTNEFKVDSLAVLEALKRMTVINDKTSKRVLFMLDKNTLSIMSKEAETGDVTEEIECEYSGEPITIALNYAYIKQPLEAMDVAYVKIGFTAQMKALTLKADPQILNSFHIIMPMDPNK